MPPQPAASLPLHITEPALPPAPPEPDKIVECGFCHVSGLSSQMTDIGGDQYRCDILVPAPDGVGCVQRNIRWRETGSKPAPLLSSAELMAASALEPLPEPEAPVLPPVQEEALENFQAAHDAQDAAEAGETRSEDDGAAEDGEPAPVADESEPDGGEGE
jgi:hypothetical protein